MLEMPQKFSKRVRFLIYIKMTALHEHRILTKKINFTRLLTKSRYDLSQVISKFLFHVSHKTKSKEEAKKAKGQVINNITEKSNLEACHFFVTLFTHSIKKTGRFY